MFRLDVTACPKCNRVYNIDYETREVALINDGK